MIILFRSLLAISALFLGSCRLASNLPAYQRLRSLSAEVPAAPVAPAPPPLYSWEGEGVPGPVSIRIDLSEQKANIFKSGRQVGWTTVATGRPNTPTPAGSFRVLEKIADKSSTRYGVIVNSEGEVIDSDAATGRESIPRGCRFVGAKMPYWQRLTGYGIGMHAGHIPVPGMPASHGCIRLPLEMAVILFQQTSPGTSVQIMP